MFDVYLSAGCRTLPDLHEFVQQAPLLEDPRFHEKVLSRHPGFLGVDLAEQEARRLLALLKSAKARGQVVPSAYRSPKVLISDALPVAERAIAKLHETHFTEYRFEPVHFWSEGPRWWIFLAGSEQLQKEGVSPGALFAYVDKLDGHIWQEDEMSRAVGVA